MRTDVRFTIVFAAALAVLLCLSTAFFAQASDKTAKPEKDGAKPVSEEELSPSEKLALHERRIAEQYKHLEDVLLRMAELSAGSDPRRAALLKRAVAQSKDKLITVRLEQLVELLDKDQLSRAMESQSDLDLDLNALLELLMSENRSKSIEKEKERIRKYIKDLNRIIKQEKDIQGRTLGGDNTKRLSEEQGKLAEKTGGLADKMKADSGGKKSDDGGQKGDKGEKGKEGKKGEKKEGKKGDKDADSEKKDGEKGEEKSDADGQKGDKGEKGQKGQQQQQQDQQKNPAEKRLQKAKQKMKEAEKKLKEAQHEGAAEKQEEALRELEQAKAELEEILRQLREEQIARLLAMLEARFRKMMQMQQQVYVGTLRLDAVPAKQRTHNHEIESSRLSGKESLIVVEVDKALLLLREDGTAVAFPEAIEQMREDMRQVVQRLSRAKVGKITQGIEEDILEALKDMVEALKKAQKDLDDRKQQQGKPHSGKSQEPPLVDLLAEIRMIRALQMRVNKRTNRYSKMIEGEQADNPELLDALQRLADREKRIHRVTRDLGMGKNK